MSMGRKLRQLMGAFHQFAGFPKIKELEAKYLPADEVKNMYEQAVGL